MISNLTPTHIHLLLNHFPTIGFSIAIGLFIGAIVGRSDDLKKASLTVLVAVAILTFPTYLSGNAADQAIRKLPDVSKTLIATHEGAALLSFVFMQLTGAAAWLALWQMRRVGAISTRTLTIVLALAIVTMGLVTQAANIGGEIRHPEIRLATESTTLEGPLGRDVAHFVNAYPWMWPSLESLHFVGLSLLMGPILALNLRVLGFMKQVSVDAIDLLIPWAVLGFGLNIVTGMLFFIAVPDQYTQSVPFMWKAALIVLAAFNGLYFTAYDRAFAMKPGDEAPLLSKAIAVSAFVLWVGVMYYGSMLPYIGTSA